MSTDYSIGADIWPGLGKLSEECGELIQVIGKLIAYRTGPHPDGGAPLPERLTEEVADVLAALHFVIEANGLDDAWILERSAAKLDRFNRWHSAGVGRS